MLLDAVLLLYTLRMGRKYVKVSPAVHLFRDPVINQSKTEKPAHGQQTNQSTHSLAKQPMYNTAVVLL